MIHLSGPLPWAIALSISDRAAQSPAIADLDRIEHVDIETVQYETALRFHRPTKKYLAVRRVARIDLELFENIVKADAFDRLADVDAQRAILVMRADRHHRSCKSGIGHSWGSEEELAGEEYIVVHYRQHSAAKINCP